MNTEADPDDLTPSYGVDAGIATITLRRPRFANRLEAADLPRLARYFDNAQGDPAVKVLVIAARGRHFCGGYDLSGFADLDAVVTAGVGPNPFEPFVDRLEAVGKPVVAAIHGGVYGGAIDIALACDFRLGSKDARMFMPALKIGLQYYVSGLERYVATLGLQNTRRILMSGATFDAGQMLQMGMLDELFDSTEALGRGTFELAQRLAALAPIAVAGTKAVLRQVAHQRVDLDELRRHESRAWTSRDLVEGLAAAQQKREPRFAGQ